MTIDIDELHAVCGGMKWENLPQSNNVEDRRGWSRLRTWWHKPVQHEWAPPYIPRPNDLSSQAGINDIESR